MIVLRVLRGPEVRVPLLGARVCAGFPSPADDHVEDALDPTALLIRNPASTFFMRVEGSSMVEAGIHDGDVLVVDRALEPRHGHVVVAVIDGLLSIKRVEGYGAAARLVFANRAYGPHPVAELSDVSVWGVVTWALHRLPGGP